MESFRNAKKVRLSNRDGKYLVAEDNESSVVLDRNGSLERAKWNVEFTEGFNFICLKSCYNKYLTICFDRVGILTKGLKVQQTSSSFGDPHAKWQPIKDGKQIKLKSQRGFLRGYKGFYRPWRNSVGHYPSDETQRSDWQWNVEIVEHLEGHEDTMTHKQPPPHATQVPQATQVPTGGRATTEVCLLAPCVHGQGKEASRRRRQQLGVSAASVAVGAAGVGVSAAALGNGDAGTGEGGAVDGDAGEVEEAGVEEDLVAVEDVDTGVGDWEI